MVTRRALIGYVGAALSLMSGRAAAQPMAPSSKANPPFGIFTGTNHLSDANKSDVSPNTLRVLHWWTSRSERLATQVLADALKARHLIWRDEAIPGGAGVGAGKVLRGRVLAGNAPEATQIVGTSIAVWAGLGLLLEFDSVARKNNWKQVLFPTIFDLIRYRGHVVAAPLGIHRVNWLFFNQSVFRKLNLNPPRTWSEFNQVAERLRGAGYIPLAQSGESWQLASLFENLVLAHGGKAIFTGLFVQHNPIIAEHPQIAEALLHLRQLRIYMPRQVLERGWTETVGDLVEAKAVMMVMGDWAKAEILVTGGDEVLGCTAVPGTEAYHLYSVDTLTMFTTDYSHVAAQEELATLSVDKAVQWRYNQAKGSVPVRRDFDTKRLDSCALASWQAFAVETKRVPSMVHRMATDDATKNAIIAEVHRYFYNETITPAQTQYRLAGILRALATQTNIQDP